MDYLHKEVAQSLVGHVGVTTFAIATANFPIEAVEEMVDNCMAKIRQKRLDGFEYDKEEINFLDRRIGQVKDEFMEGVKEQRQWYEDYLKAARYRSGDYVEYVD